MKALHSLRLLSSPASFTLIILFAPPPFSFQSLQDIPTQIIPLGEIKLFQPPVYKRLIDHHLLPPPPRRHITQLFQNTMHDRVQPPRANVLLASINLLRETRHGLLGVHAWR